MTNNSPRIQPPEALYVLQVLSAYVVAVFLCCVAVALFYINENIAVSIQRDEARVIVYRQ